MIKNKPFIDSVIQGRNEKNDPPQEVATRNKASPIAVWCKFIPFSNESFNNIFKLPIDGVKIKFRYVTVIFNGRHKSK
jgi:hypothetical protein